MRGVFSGRMEVGQWPRRGNTEGPVWGPWRNPAPSPTQYSLTPNGRIVMRKIMTASRRHGGDERVGPRGSRRGEATFSIARR